MGKQTHHPFDSNTHPATEVLECIHIDLWGLLSDVNWWEMVYDGGG